MNDLDEKVSVNLTLPENYAIILKEIALIAQVPLETVVAVAIAQYIIGSRVEEKR